MAQGLYNRFLANLMNKEIDMEADVIKFALLDNSHTFDKADNLWTDVSANEIIGIGYTAEGATLAGKAVTQGSPTIFDANYVSWTGATFSAWHGVLYSGLDLIGSLDFGGEIAIADGTVNVIWDPAGIITLT